MMEELLVIKTIFLTGIDGTLPKVRQGSVSWADYDNDGDMDFLLTGNNGTKAISQIWKNNLGVTGVAGFTNETASLIAEPAGTLPGVQTSSVSWADNDGDMDFLLTGESTELAPNGGPVSQIWRNNISAGTNTFTKQTSIVLPGVKFSSISWADYDNDGYMDFLLTGQSTDNVLISQVWHNNGNNGFSNTTTTVASGLLPVYQGAVSWADYDNDGYMDFLLTGKILVIGTGYVPKSVIWRNNANGTFSDNTTIAPNLPDIAQSSVNWADMDNDGDLDFLLTGATNGSPSRISEIWQNNNGTSFSKFTNASSSITATLQSSVNWADIDNDGDLDFLLTGYASIPTSEIWQNNIVTPNNTTNINTVPTAPATPSLSSTVSSGGNTTLSWGAGSDAKTLPAGLTYNVRVGTAPGGSQIVSPQANLTNGFRKVVLQ